MELQSRGKYTACIDQRMTSINHPTNRRDYNERVSSCTINNYLRNLRVFFTWLEETEYIHIIYSFCREITYVRFGMPDIMFGRVQLRTYITISLTYMQA